MATPEEWFRSLPPVTKSWLVASFATTCCLMLGLLGPHMLYFDPSLVFHKFEIWRLVTNFLFLGKFSLPFIFQIYLLCKYSGMYEADPFSPNGIGMGTTSDYVCMLIFCAAAQLLVSYLLGGIPFLGSSMIFLVLYMWSRKNPDFETNFWGFNIKGIHVPWCFLALSILLGNSPVMDLMGIGTGHLYYFLVVVVPAQYGKQLLWTPDFMKNIFDPFSHTRTFTSAGSYHVGRRPQGPPGGTRSASWGSGNVLGRD